MKARAVYILIAVMLATVVLQPSVAPVHGSEREIVILMRVPSEERMEAMDRLPAEFERRNPGTKVHVIPGHEEEVLTMVAGGVPPNFWHQGLDTFETWVAGNGLQSIDHLLARDGLRLEDHFIPPAVQGARSGGMTYAIPANVNVDVLYFNAEMFAQAGLAPPPSTWDDPTWTWDVFRETARKLTRDVSGDGQPDVYALGFRNMLGVAFGRIFGGEWVRENQFVGDSPEVRQALEWVHELIHVDRTIPMPSVAGQFRMERGETAMRWFHSGGWATFGGTDIEWDMAALPSGTTPWRFAHVNTLKFVANAPNLDVAYEFAKFMQMDPTFAADFADAYGGFPSYIGALGPYLHERLTPRQGEVLLGAVERMQPWALGQVSNDQIYNVINQQVNRYLNLDAPLEAGIENMRNAVNSILRDAR